MKFGPPEPLQSMMMLLGCGSSGAGGVSVSDEAAQFLARLAPEPETALRADYITFIDGCVAAGIWDLLECVQSLAVDHEGQAIVNLKSNAWNGNPEAGFGGTLTWTANQGYFTTGLARYSTEFDPSAASIFGQNSGFVGVYSLTAEQTNAQMVNMAQSGSLTVSGKISVFPKWSNNDIYGNIATTTQINLDIGAGAASNGWFVVQRNASPVAQVVRKNGDQLVSGGQASSDYTAGEKIKLICQHQTAFFVAGSELSEAQHDALYALVVAFLTSRGAI